QQSGRELEPGLAQQRGRKNVSEPTDERLVPCPLAATAGKICESAHGNSARVRFPTLPKDVTEHQRVIRVDRVIEFKRTQSSDAIDRIWSVGDGAHARVQNRARGKGRVDRGDIRIGNRDDVTLISLHILNAAEEEGAIPQDWPAERRARVL